MNERWYELTPEQIAFKCGSNLSAGLSKQSAAKKLRLEGENRIIPENRGKYSGNLRHILADLTVILLIFSALISSVFDRSVSAVVIICLVVFNLAVMVAAFLRARDILKDTSSRAEPPVKVVRDGKVGFIRSEEIVTGDIIFFTEGDIIPADARIIQSEGLTVSEYQVTGQRNPVRKRAGFTEARSGGELTPEKYTNMLFATSIVMSGSGRAIICSTSGNTELCRNGKQKPTAPPYERLRIFELMRGMGSVWSLCMLASVFVIVVLDLIIGSAERGLFESFITALTLAVASMSSYFLSFTYVVVACGVMNARMGRGNGKGESGALIKNTDKIEVAKDLTAIVIPRSSLIVGDTVRIERIFAGGSERRPGDHGFRKRCGAVLRLAVVSTGIYGARRLVHKNINGENIYTKEENVLISCSSSLGLYNVSLDREYPMADHYSGRDEGRFDTTLYYDGKAFRAVSRGTALSVLRCCTSVRGASGIHAMTDEERSGLARYVTAAEKDFCRVIAVAEKETAYTNLRRIVANQTDLTLEGIIVIKEPVTPGAAKNIAACADAGIKVIMTSESTGKSGELTARALGIVKNDSEIVSGSQISGMNPEIFRINIPSYRYYFGVTPGQIEAIVTLMEQDGERVGIISRGLDGISAMRAASVAFALTEEDSGEKAVSTPILTGSGQGGRKGAAARFLSDVVLAPAGESGSGGFNAAVGTVKCSVQTCRNIVRIISYLMATQAARLLLVLLGVLGAAGTLTPVQILYSGFIIDLAAVFTIAFQPPSPYVLRYRGDIGKRIERPFYSGIPYLAFGAAWAALTAALPVIATAFGVSLTAPEITSATFAGFMLAQFFVLSEVKRESSIFSPNVRFNGIGTLLAVVCAALVAVSLLRPRIGELFGIVPFGKAGIIIMLIPSMFMIAALEIFKLVRSGKGIRDYVTGIFGGRKKLEIPVAEADPSHEVAKTEHSKTVSELFESFDLDSFIEPSEGGEVAGDIAAAQPDGTHPGEDDADVSAASADEKQPLQLKKEEYAIGKDIIDSLFSAKNDGDDI